MKLIVLLTFLMSQFALATGARIVTLSDGAPSSTTFSSTDSQSRATACSGNTITILNQTDSVWAVGIGTANTTPSSDLYYVPPGPNSGIEKHPESPLGSQNYLYLRTPDGAETGGTVQVTCTTENK